MFWTTDVYILNHVSCDNQQNPLYTCIYKSLRIKSSYENDDASSNLLCAAISTNISPCAAFSAIYLFALLLQKWCFFHQSLFFQGTGFFNTAPLFFDRCVAFTNPANSSNLTEELLILWWGRALLCARCLLRCCIKISSIIGYINWLKCTSFLKHEDHHTHVEFSISHDIL